ncbi:MAG: ornithine--oxo-acid transaminase [Candidatus Dojkabacteria bacterium]|nr:ornithine--oxo-acid transaminase [Candidatus Dojkabacteria bacterium]
MSNKSHIRVNDSYGAHNYHPLPIVISKAKGVWVWDAEGKKYMDMLSAYSALNQGHRNEYIIKKVKEQLNRVTLTSRAFHNDKLPLFLKKVCEFSGFQMALPMNTGAEAVETALKMARKWGYYKKKVEPRKAQIIVAANNFHGRTISIISFSTEDQYRDGFGPFTPGFKVVKYGDSQAIKKAINKNTVAVMIEPIQGEGGIIIPPKGYLREVRKITRENKVLLMLDEIQTGLARTGKNFAYEWENIKPDVLILGKALGGGIMPVSVVLSSRSIMSVFKPGDHGSTFGGNPLGSAAGIAALEYIEKNKLAQRALELGDYFVRELRNIKSEHIKDVRGRGLLIGVELDTKAREYAEKLMKDGLLCKETHDYVLRFAPPLVITKEEIDWALGKIRKFF